MPLNRALFNPALYRRVRDVWFAGLAREAAAAPDHIVQTRWYAREAEDRNAFDGVCKENFGEVLASIGPERGEQNVIARELVEEIEKEKDQERLTETALSIILLLDQIPRNSFRSRETLPLVFAHYDPIARAVLNHILARNPRPDQHPLVRYSSARRGWFYLPLMHSEDRADHERIVAILKEYEEDVRSRGSGEGHENEKNLGWVMQMRDFEGTHKVIIDRFGRYPYRNAALGRTSTKEEEEWLKDGESFGVSG